MTQSLSREELLELAIGAVKEVSDEEIEITPETSLLLDMGIDSLTMIRLDLILQSRTGLSLSVDHLDKIDTVNDLVDTLLEHGKPVEDD